MEQRAHPEIEHTKRPELERGKYPPNVLVLCPTSLGTPLPNSGSSTFGILAHFYPLLRHIDNRRRSRDPFTDTRWAVPEFCAVQFAKCQESYGVSVDKKNVLKIDGHYASFLFEQSPKEIHILLGNLSADMQDQKTRRDSRRTIHQCIYACDKREIWRQEADREAEGYK